MKTIIAATMVLAGCLACRPSSQKSSTRAEHRPQIPSVSDSFIEPAEIFDVRVSDTLSALRARLGDEVREALMPAERAYGRRAYRLLMPTLREEIVVFPTMNGQEEVVQRVEYRGAWRTAQGVGVGSSLGDLMGVYPDLKVSCDAVSSKVQASGAGYSYLLDCSCDDEQLTLERLKMGVRVAAIVLN